MRITVLGGAVMDLVFRVPALPAWNESVQAYDYETLPGGKGLNQAIAARRLGADAALISAVGDDPFGNEILKTLDKERVGRTHVVQVERAETAVTGVFTTMRKTTSVPAADAAFVGWKSLTRTHVGQDAVERAEQQIRVSDALLLTYEVSVQALASAIRIVHGSDVLVIVKPAPPLEPHERLDEALLSQVHCLVPNAWDAALLLGHDPARLSPEDAALDLHKMGIPIVCVTLAGDGCVVAADGRLTRYAGYLCHPIDTTGASDAFCAALAVAMIEGCPPSQAFERANAAGAITVSRRGRYVSMPTALEIEDFVRARSTWKVAGSA